MKHADIKAMMAEIAPVIKEYASSALEPVLARLDEIERRFAAIPVPKDGKDADPVEVASIVRAELVSDLKALRDAVDAIPPAPELPDIAGMIAEAMSALPDPVSAEAVMEMVNEAVAAIPLPKDGRDGLDVSDVDLTLSEDGCTMALRFTIGDMEHAFEVPLPVGPSGENGKDGKDGRDGIDGKDGAGIKDLLIDRDGNLVASFTDGRMKSLGSVIGKDGEPGKDGAPGKDGRDGFGFDDLDMVEGDEGVFLRFSRGDVVKSFRLPVVTDRGVYREGTSYLKGNGVTWGGCFWIAQKDNPEGKPDSPDSDWRLAVKRGQNGKDLTK